MTETSQAHRIHAQKSVPSLAPASLATHKSVGLLGHHRVDWWGYLLSFRARSPTPRQPETDFWAERGQLKSLK